MSASKKVRVGVVGLGYWGPNLVRNFDRIADAELAYCCDLDEANLARASALYPQATMTDDLNRLLQDDSLDAVVVATSVPTHYAIGMHALQAGKHTFIEKPIALRASHAEDLLTAAAANGVKLMVGHLLEYHPAVRKLKELIGSGDLGRVFYIYANRLNLGKVRTDENALWSFAPHDISVLNYLVGEEPEEVSARGECYLQDGVEDVVFGYIKYPSGIVGHIHVSWLDPHKSRKITVVGSEKMVVFDDMEADRKVTIYDKGATTTRAKFDNYGEFVTLHFGDIHIPRIGNEEPLRIEAQHFIDCVREDRQPLSDGRDALNVVRVLEAMQRSLQNGGQPIKTADLTHPPQM
ncbi:MAG: Gfo/Idh/MocA family oxidoreductase [Thermoleophilia bacterium]